MSPKQTPDWDPELHTNGIRETQEDLAQETLLRMVRTKTTGGRFDEAKRFSHWMFGIARNVHNDALRDQYIAQNQSEGQRERTLLRPRMRISMKYSASLAPWRLRGKAVST